MKTNNNIETKHGAMTVASAKETIKQLPKLPWYLRELGAAIIDAETGKEMFANDSHFNLKFGENYDDKDVRWSDALDSISNIKKEGSEPLLLLEFRGTKVIAEHAVKSIEIKKFNNGRELIDRLHITIGKVERPAPEPSFYVKRRRGPVGIGGYSTF